MKNRKVSMQHIADKLGISKVSVSKALNNQPGVSDQLKLRIIETAREMGYNNETKNTGLSSDRFVYVVPKRFFFENENFYTQIYYYLSKRCQANNKELSLLVISTDDEKKLFMPQMLNKENIDGIFLAGEISQAYMYALKSLNIPLISIDHYDPQMKIDRILVDNFTMSCSLTTYLLNKGHRKIGFTGNLYQSNYIDRYYGFQKAFAFNGVQFSDKYNIVIKDRDAGPYFADFELPEEMPTAFVCTCDMTAYFLMQKLQANGYNIPDDISIVSFDNVDISKSCKPKLTTVDISKRDFAESAYDQLLERIDNPASPVKTLYIQTEIIERESVRELRT